MVLLLDFCLYIFSSVGVLSVADYALLGGGKPKKTTCPTARPAFEHQHRATTLAFNHAPTPRLHLLIAKSRS